MLPATLSGKISANHEAQIHVIKQLERGSLKERATVAEDGGRTRSQHVCDCRMSF